MNIEWLVPCRYIEVHDNLATMVGAGINTWTVPGFPVPIQVTLGVQFVGTAEELAEPQQHEMCNRIYGPDGTLVDETVGQAEIGLENPNTEWLNALVLPFACIFEARSPGTYQLEHSIDGNAKQIPLHVVQGDPADFA